ncbi:MULTISPECIES: hypothetical protein [Nostocales]|uniref:Uncharacterized protein n=3 Tax=Nostocales TaxID=1161 RepID=A0A0C1NK30_9CYAN|nr:hypothetical protein [Tolypothrix bouteillei]KAF3887849.1 hypothetical protein DA73_0400021910 [Tolypothrix bouteillei VB521301]
MLNFPLVLIVLPIYASLSYLQEPTINLSYNDNDRTSIVQASKQDKTNEIHLVQVPSTTETQIPTSIFNWHINLASRELKSLKFFGKDWKADYNAAMDSWTLTQINLPDSVSYNDTFAELFVSTFPDDAPTNVNAFAEKLKSSKFLDWGFVWTEVRIIESDSNGFLIRGIQMDTQDKAKKPVFVMLRTIAGKKILFQSSFSPAPDDLKILDKMIELAKTAKF